MKKQIALIATYIVSVIILLMMTNAYHSSMQTSVTRRVVAVSAWVIFTSLILAVLLLYNHNRELKNNNRKLYERVKRELETREHAKIMRQKLQEQIERLEDQLAQRNDTEDEKNNKSKYESSRLDEATRDSLVVRIIDVMDSSDEIYSNNFSLKRLTELVGANYKYVSQAINETFNVNFSSLLNEYRIKEACRRLGDLEHYGNQTIEAVAESVGFKSRSNFVTTFKRITGVTPSEYQRQATAPES